MTITLQWWQLGLVGLGLIALAGWESFGKGRRCGFNEGYAQGHTRGVLDATPWTCGQGHANPPNNVMCRVCGIDRFDDADVLRELHEEDSGSSGRTK